VRLFCSHKFVFRLLKTAQIRVVQFLQCYFQNHLNTKFAIKSQGCSLHVPTLQRLTLITSVFGTIFFFYFFNSKVKNHLPIWIVTNISQIIS